MISTTYNSNKKKFYHNKKVNTLAYVYYILFAAIASVFISNLLDSYVFKVIRSIPLDEIGIMTAVISSYSIYKIHKTKILVVNLEEHSATFIIIEAKKRFRRFENMFDTVDFLKGKNDTITVPYNNMKSIQAESTLIQNLITLSYVDDDNQLTKRNLALYDVLEEADIYIIKRQLRTKGIEVNF
ncbi:hypothetical protein ACSIGC_09520 [Tenacibaculum sp. ZS6-P6]|uniref:hypothetical protein n=1 Tax=Tenacibaculum sp. ZS6-P6 TaxID=3447503 RepID=UPI003F9BA388